MSRTLTPRSVGPVLRILLPVVTGFCWFIAWQWWIATPVEVANSAVLRTLNGLPSLRAWAAMIGAGALLMTVALILQRRTLYIYALAVATAPYLFMSLVALLAALNGVVSSSAWAWSAFVSVVCMACIRGLSTREG